MVVYFQCCCFFPLLYYSVRCTVSGSSSHNDSTSTQGSSHHQGAQTPFQKATSSIAAVNHPGSSSHSPVNHAAGPALNRGSRNLGKPQELDVMQLQHLPPRATAHTSPVRSSMDYNTPAATQAPNFSTFRGSQPLATSSKAPSPISHPAPPPPPRAEYNTTRHSSPIKSAYNNNAYSTGPYATLPLNGATTSNNIYSKPARGGTTGGNLKWTGPGETAGAGGTMGRKKEVRFAEDCRDKNEDACTDYTSSMDGISDDGTTTSGSYIMDTGEVRGITLDSQINEVSV